MEDEASLREAVEEQARALVRGDLATFGSCAMPEALTQLYRSERIRGARRYELARVDEDGDTGTSVVRLAGPTTCELHGVWERKTDGWKAVALDIPTGAVRLSWWRRALSRRKPLHPPHEELA